jgi:hypothetical protein
MVRFFNFINTPIAVFVALVVVGVNAFFYFGQPPLRPGSLRIGLVPQAPRPKDSLPRGQERQEAGGGGRSEEAIRALASVVG